jgi:hypothetical protein
MSDDLAATAPVDLAAISLLVGFLQSQSRPLSAAQRESAAAMQRRICAAPWATAEDRNKAHGLVLRLALLLGEKEVPANHGRGDSGCCGRDAGGEAKPARRDDPC